MEANGMHVRPTKTTITSFVRQSSKMKYTLSEERIVILKKVQGQLTVAVRQKDSDVKYAEFRYTSSSFSYFIAD